MSPTPSVSVIYVNYLSFDDLSRSLKSMLTHTKLNLEVIVVDNDSGENLDGLREIFDDVNLIYVESNLGFGKACNLAVQKASAPYVLLLNPDTLFSEPSLDRAFEAYQNLPADTRGALTCRHVDCDGSLQATSLQRSHFPSWPFFKIRKNRLKYSATDFINKDPNVNKAHARSHESFAVYGSFYLIETDLMKAYPFDEDFFLYAEEIDVCRRLYQAGRPCHYIADTTIMHTAARAEKSHIIRHQIYLSNALLVLKLYGRLGYVYYLWSRWVKASIMLLVSLFIGPGGRRQIKNYFSDAKPFL